MKFLKSISVILLFFISCKQAKQTDITESVIANGKMPAIAKDANNTLHVVYGSGDSIMYIYSNDEGKSFSKPELVDTLSNLVASATRGPQIAAIKNGVAIIAVNSAGNIFSFIKESTGKWTRTASVNDEGEVDKEGFSGLSSDGNSNLFAIWTDLRDDKHNKIFGARSTDAGKTWSKNILVYQSPDSTVCECCKPSVAMQGNNVYVMFRNWLNGNRDLYLLQSSNGGESFGKAEKLGRGSWKLDGCPMDGGGLAIAANGIAQTVWRRQNKIYSAQVNAEEKEIGEGKSCTVETVNGKNIYGWTDGDGNIVCLLPDGSKKIVGKGSLPVLKAISDDKVICVWEKDKNIERTIFTL
jgi:hypothetical protein